MGRRSAGPAGAWICGLLFAGATVVPTSAGEATGRIRIGEPFPVEAFPTVDGGSWSIRSERGRRVVLHVFASW